MILEASTLFIRSFLGNISPQGVCNVHRAIAEVVIKSCTRSLVEVPRLPRDGLIVVDAIASVTLT